LADEQNAGWIKAKSVDGPLAADDLKFLQYNHGASKFQLVAAAGGGDMLKAVYDTDADNVVESADNADTVDGVHAAGLATNAHAATHVVGGSDAFLTTDLLSAIAKTTARANSGANVGSRRRFNFLDGTNTTWTVSDVPASEEVTVRVDAPLTGVVYKLVPTYTVYKSGGTYYAMDEDGTIDFSGANAATVINAALAALATGGWIHLKAATYTVKGLNPLSNTLITGEGPSTILKLPAALAGASEDNNVIYINGKTNVEICHLTIDGSQGDYARLLLGDAGHNTFCGIKTNLSTHTHFHHLYVHDVRRSGILHWGTFHAFTPLYAVVSHSYFENCNWDAVEYSDCSDAIVSDCQMTGTSDVLFGLWICKRITFSHIMGYNGNRNLGSVNGHNIMSFDGDVPTTFPTEGCSVLNSQFSNFNGEGLLFLNGANHCIVADNYFYDIDLPVIVEYANNKYCRDNVIANNSFVDCLLTDSEGIIEIQSVTNYGGWVISNNIFDNTTQVTGTFSDAIRIDGGTNFVIIGNKIKNVVSKGISLNVATYCEVVNNLVFDDRGGSLLDIGIRETGAADYNVIAGNIIRAASTPITLVGGHSRTKDNIGYNPVGNVATPWTNGAGFLLDAAAALDNPVSHALYTVGQSPKLIILTNCGGISAVQIDGNTLTGVTTHDPQIYQLNPGQTIHVVWATTTPHGEVYAQ
jgi:hypothetical protein